MTRLSIQKPEDPFLPVTESAAADDVTVFKGVFHITHDALRNLRNTTADPASKENRSFQPGLDSYDAVLQSIRASLKE